MSTSFAPDISRIFRHFGLARALTFARHAYRAPQNMRAWDDFVSATFPPEAHDGMLLRPLRPYMREYFSVDARRALIRTHYTSLATLLRTQAALAGEPGALLSTLTGKSGEAYRLHLGRCTSKEGELTFDFLTTRGESLAKLSVAIGEDEHDARVLWIGGLQGAKPPLGRDDIVRATRDLNGLRPKGAVLFAAQRLAQLAGLSGLRAPSNEGHISSNRLGSFQKKRRIHADYGQFWEEIGGSKLSDTEYVLPLVSPVRDISEVKRDKRREWKKRQAFFEQIGEDVATAIAAMR